MQTELTPMRGTETQRQVVTEAQRGLTVKITHHTLTRQRGSEDIRSTKETDVAMQLRNSPRIEIMCQSFLNIEQKES